MQKSIFFWLWLCCLVGSAGHAGAKPILFNNYIYKHHVIHCPKLTGRVIYPGDEEYDRARLVSNYYTSRNKFPDVIVFCQETQDVQNAVKWARCHGIPIRVRSGGHNHEAFSTGSGVILIDLSEMKQVQLDRSRETAVVQPGINNQELYGKLYKEGLTHVGGTCSEVALGGLVLTGGMGPLLRKVGLTCDSVNFLEIVNADGKLLYITKDNEYKDLFWACCGGGGGNFGIVTSIGIKVYPTSPVTWFNIGWNWNQPIDQVLMAWQDFFTKPDRRWFSHLDVWSKPFPQEKFEKMPVKVLGVFWGTPEEAQKELTPLLNVGKPSTQSIELVHWDQSIRLIEESTAVFLTSKPEYKSTGAFAMDDLPAEAIKIIVDTLHDTSSPLFNVLLFSMGGAVQDISPTDTAYFYREAKYFINYTVQWLNEVNDRKRIHELNQLRQRLLPYTEGNYVGNPDLDIKDFLVSYYGDNVDRLRCVKRKYDPENVFHFEQSIPPAPIIWKCSE